jgi:hypothetical protein
MAKRRACFLQERAAGLRHLHPACFAAEKLHMELAFDRLNLLAERWLLHAEPLGGPGDVPLFRDSDDIAEMP